MNMTTTQKMQQAHRNFERAFDRWCRRKRQSTKVVRRVNYWRRELNRLALKAVGTGRLS